MQFNVSMSFDTNKKASYKMYLLLSEFCIDKGKDK